jgi:hypothetical protein
MLDHIPLFDATQKELKETINATLAFPPCSNPDATQKELKGTLSARFTPP